MSSSTTANDNNSDPQTPPWPPSVGLSTHIVPRSKTIFAMSGSSHIHAPAALVWSFIQDTSTYSAWNTFTPRAHITSQPSTSSPATSAEQPPPFEAPVSTSQPANNPKDTPSPSPILQKGTRFTFDVILQPTTNPSNITPTALRVTDISTPAEPSRAYIPADDLRDDGSFWPDLDRVYRIAWTTEGTVVSLGLRGERITEIVALPPAPASASASASISTSTGPGTPQQQQQQQQCLYRTWECQSGALARVVRWKYGATLQERFADHAADVKKEAERRWAVEREKGKEEKEEGG